MGLDIVDAKNIAAAATQTISASNQTIQHNNKAVVLLSSNNGYTMYWLGSTNSAIADGTVDGQSLLLLWHGAEYDEVVIKDNPPTSNCKLQGDWDRYYGINEQWLALRWNATDSNWWETGRGGNSNTNSQPYTGSIGGSFNTNASGGAGSVGGGSNSNNGAYSGSVGGQNNTNSINCGSVGGNHNDNSGQYSGSVGGYYGKCRHVAETLLSSHKRSAAGDAQATSYLLKGTSTTDTLVELTSPGRWILEATRTVGFRITVIGRKSDGTKHAMYVVDALLNRDASNNTSIVGQNPVSVIETDATWDYEITNDDTNESIKIRAKGASGETVYWIAHIIPVVCG